MPTIITAGDAVSNATSYGSGNDGAVSIVVGPAGGKLTAMTIAADGTPTFIKAPISGKVSGEVIQVVVSQDAGTSTISTTPVNLSVSAQAITPKSTSSKILVCCTFLATIANLAATNVQGAFQLYDSANAVLFGYNVLFGPASGGGGTGMTANQTIEFFVANSALTARSFSLRGNTGNASAAFTAQQCFWTLTEVQV